MPGGVQAYCCSKEQGWNPMRVTYVIRYLNAEGGMLRLYMTAFPDDSQAIREASTGAPPAGCAVVEVDRGDKCIWRRVAGDPRADCGGAGRRSEVKTAA